MNEKTDIRAVDMVRQIRDEQAERLRGKTDAEIIEFFRRSSARARAEASRRSGDPPAAA
jgi:hypothetical protein